MFIEVQSAEKNCPVIINLDHIIEIAPLTSGGCALFMNDGAGVNSRNALRVKDEYNMFKQFALQTVTPEMISARFPKVSVDTETPNVDVPRGRGRPPKVHTDTEQTGE